MRAQSSNVCVFTQSLLLAACTQMLGVGSSLGDEGCMVKAPFTTVPQGCVTARHRHRSTAHAGNDRKGHRRMLPWGR